MRFLLLNLLFLGTALISRSQQLRYVYLQTDNKQPFYVRLNEKVFSSSAAGYVVIPKLTDGVHTLSIGFPKNEWPVQNLQIKVAAKDMGYLLKNFGAKGWGLFNLQTLEVINSSSPSSETVSTKGKEDEFSNVLADVVNTPSIKEEKKKVPVANPSVKQEEPVKETIKPVEKSLRSDVVKISSANDTDGMVVIYHDKQASGTDTINIFIPGGKQVSKEKKPEPVFQAQDAGVKENTPAVEKKNATAAKGTETTAPPKFIDIEIPPGSTDSSAGKKSVEADIVKTAAVTTENTVSKPATAPLMINSDCKQIATDEDFFKIRKKMSSEKTDDNMVAAAGKMFKQKCYSTEQIKNLSVLFLDDEGKYKLFDAAYPHVFDTHMFRQLESQLKDQYIINRFRAMLRN